MFNLIVLALILPGLVVNPYTIAINASKQLSEPLREVQLATWYDYTLQTKDQKCRQSNCYSKSNSTCASRDFERGTNLLVKNIKNNKKVICRVNDYGPAEWTGKDIDLSSFAFKQIAPLFLGVIEVEIYER